jgi:hypothetical protein
MFEVFALSGGETDSIGISLGFDGIPRKLRLFDERHYTPQQLAEKRGYGQGAWFLLSFVSQSNLHCYSAERLPGEGDQ